MQYGEEKPVARVTQDQTNGSLVFDLFQQPSSQPKATIPAAGVSSYSLPQYGTHELSKMTAITGSSPITYSSFPTVYGYSGTGNSRPVTTAYMYQDPVGTYYDREQRPATRQEYSYQYQQTQPQYRAQRSAPQPITYDYSSGAYGIDLQQIAQQQQTVGAYPISRNLRQPGVRF
jgi:hypothetical protein